MQARVKHCCRCQVDSCILMASCVLTVAGLVIFLFAVASPYPLHASCKIKWAFGISCASVKADIVRQMKKWNGLCPEEGTEKCLYNITSQSETQVKGTHQTPVKHYVDDLTFSFLGSGGSCNVQGFSTSRTWYAYLDYGTNYCNLENLITGSTLDKATGYSEETSDSVCTDYTSRNCDKY